MAVGTGEGTLETFLALGCSKLLVILEKRGSGVSSWTETQPSDELISITTKER